MRRANDIVDEQKEPSSGCVTIAVGHYYRGSLASMTSFQGWTGTNFGWEYNASDIIAEQTESTSASVPVCRHYCGSPGFNGIL